jgi:hypothetical protein
MSVVTITQNGWAYVPLPKGCDPTWSEADRLFYGSKWIAARDLGFSEQRAQQLAEAAVSKRLYPGLEFDRGLERDLEKIDS